MTRLWIRNLTSRNDSRTGAWDIRRCGGGAPVGAPGPVGPLGAAGSPGAAGAGPAPGRALSIRFSSDIASNPLSPREAHFDRRHHRNENNDFFWAVLRISSRGVATRSPATACASRRMSWETWASRLERKKGTPRLRAYTTDRPSLTIV